MKVIHCADLHLDSALNAHLDKEHAKMRRGEILHTFERMVDYAVENDVEFILISGDMFDTKSISATTRNTVINKIIDNPSVKFMYLAGNHDNNNFLSEIEELPSNLFLFSSKWTTYSFGELKISGIELNKENNRSAYVSFVADPRAFNIVMMHGQESESDGKDETQVVNLRELRGKGIDYLALGHIHHYKLDDLDSRGKYCYPGCLEGRGFDELGKHGFVLLDINLETKKYTHEFVDFAYRELYEVTVDISDCLTSYEIISRVKNELEKCDYSRNSLIKLVLVGAIDVECEKDVAYIQANVGNQYYYFVIEDKTNFKIEIEDYIHNETLKGEFVRTVLEDKTIPEADKNMIIRYGLKAIAGEEIE